MGQVLDRDTKTKESSGALFIYFLLSCHSSLFLLGSFFFHLPIFVCSIYHWICLCHFLYFIFIFIPFSSLSLSLSLNIMDDIMCMLSFLSLALSFLYLSIIQHFHDLHYTTMGHTGTYYHWLVDYGWFA